MRICRKCGAPLDEDALFCTECGNKVEKVRNGCPNCGAAVEEGQSFCTECGTPLNVDSASNTHLQMPVAAQQPSTDYSQTQGSTAGIVEQVEKNNNTWIYVIACVFVVILLAVGGDFFLNNNGNDDGSEVEQTELIHLSLAGSIGKYPVTMQLNIEGSTVKGHYYYDKQGPGKVLTLEGVKNNDNRLYLDEFDEYGEKCGTFNGSLLNGIFEGEFVTAKGKSLYFHVSETR